MRYLLCLVVCICVFISGCAMVCTDLKLFGIKMDDPSYAKDFKILSFDKRKRVRFDYAEDKMDESVSAWGYLEPKWGLIRVLNKSEELILTKHSTDSFELVTKDGKTHQLKKPDILSYYNRPYIDPDAIAEFYILLPDAIKGIKKEDVEMIICNLGKEPDITTIVLKPLFKTYE